MHTELESNSNSEGLKKDDLKNLDSPTKTNEEICDTNNSNNNYLSKKREIIYKHKKNKIVNISYINIDSHFIFALKNPDAYFRQLNDKNKIKLNDKEYMFLKEKIKDLQIDLQVNEKNINFIDLNVDTAIEINKYFNTERRKNKIELFVEEKIKSNKSRELISCRKLAQLFLNETGEKISKTYINNLIRNNLNLSYLKSTVKTSKINSDSGIIGSFYLIKSIIKCMILGFEILYLDETSILSSNNNYRCWRKKDDEIYFNLGTKARRNLLLTISSDKIIHYKITEKNTDESNFLVYMNELYEILSKTSNKKYVIIMDNLASHRTAKMMEYYNNKRINIIFNVTYKSNFNAIELAFRVIKIKIYKNLYESIDSVIDDVKNIIYAKEFSISLKKNFIETLNVYLSFYENNKYRNLKNCII